MSSQTFDPTPVTPASVAELSTSGTAPIFSAEQMAVICGGRTESEENEGATATAAAAKEEVLCALREKRRDDIRRLAASGPHGLVCRECREKAWPFLLGVTPLEDEALSKRT